MDRQYLQLTIIKAKQKSALTIVMLCEKLKQNAVFRIPEQSGCYFCLHNIALDLESNDAVLYLLQNGKEILIAELSRLNGGPKSVNLCLDFWNCGTIQFMVSKGSVHIIGGYKKYNGAQPHTSNSNLNINACVADSQPQHKSTVSPSKPTQHEQQSITQTAQPLRRSSRSRAPVQTPQPKSAKADKRQKQALNNMAKYFQCNLSDEDDQDEDGNYEKGKEDEDDDDEEEEDKDDAEDQDQEQQDKEKEQNEMKEEKERGSSGRKVRPKSARLAAREAEKKVDQNTSTQSVTDQKMENIHGEGNFSVPTRNPYN